MKGRDLQKGIIDLARTMGWHVAHFPSVETKQGWRTPIAGDAKGWPDLLLLRDRVVAIEVKGTGDRLRPEQEQWRDRIQRAGIEWYCVTPKDWPDKVKEVLT